MGGIHFTVEQGVIRTPSPEERLLTRYTWCCQQFRENGSENAFEPGVNPVAWLLKEVMDMAVQFPETRFVLGLKAHLKLETGMGRTGFDAMDDSHLDDLLAAMELPNLDVTGIFTHMAVADEPGDPFNDLQFERFNVVIRELEQRSGKTFRLRHCANSGAVLYYPEMALDMVRPGLLLYGLYPGEDHNGFDLIPAMQLRSRVCEITTHRKGDTISYGRTFTCDRDMRLAVLPVGYADGLLRELSGKIDVKIRGHRCRQVGRICMDMCMIDVTDFPDVKVGDIATVFGKDPTATEQAEKAGTISYELLCAVSHRVPRVYVD